MLLLIVTGPDYDLAQKKIAHAKEKGAGIELRLDTFLSIDLVKIKTLLTHRPSAVVFTLRKASQGGHFKGDEIERLKLIEQLLTLKPDFFDFEWDTSAIFLEKVARTFPETKVLLSYHNFQEMPPLESLLLRMQTPSASAYKIACRAHSSIDVLKLAAFVHKKTLDGIKITGISLGDETWGRLLGPVVGNLFDYAPWDESRSTLPGQIPFSTFQSFFKERIPTRFYALIGDPVIYSCSHLTHNAVFQKLGIEALYIKIQLKSDELAPFFSLIKDLPFHGISVTMPFKEKLVSLLHDVSIEAKQIGAVNTLVLKNGTFVGHNTDGMGALDAIEERGSVKNKQILLIGAGGTARAIAFEAKKRGAHLTIANRTKARAEALANACGATYSSLDELPRHYDILIHATSVGMRPNIHEMAIPPEALLPGKVVMDVVSDPAMTKLLQEAKMRGCTLIFGRDLFLHQAKHQFNLWLEELSLEFKQPSELFQIGNE